MEETSSPVNQQIREIAYLLQFVSPFESERLAAQLVDLIETERITRLERRIRDLEARYEPRIWSVEYVYRSGETSVEAGLTADEASERSRAAINDPSVRAVSVTATLL